MKDKDKLQEEIKSENQNIKVTLQDGETYYGDTYEDIILGLKTSDWTKYEDKEQYKRNINRRATIFTGVPLSYNDDKSFIEELKRIGFITEIIEN